MNKLECQDEKRDKMTIEGEKFLVGKHLALWNAKELIRICLTCKDFDDCDKRVEYINFLDKK